MKKRLILNRIIIGITIILGSLGYLQDLFVWDIPNSAIGGLFVAFLCISVAGVLFEREKEKRAAEDFYKEEITEVFDRSDSESRIKFFIDKGQNKCAALILRHEPIPNSINLMEGGYLAPRFSIVVKQNIVVFRNSAYSNYEEYRKPGPVYSVKYYPKSSKIIFHKNRDISI